MPKLTPKTYHTKKNTYLTNSKISLFLKSKEAFYKRYVSFEDTEGETSPSIMIGKAVDLAFEKGKLSAIDKKFCCMGLKEYKESGDKRERLTEEQMEKAKVMAEKILSAPFYKEYKRSRQRNINNPPHARFQMVFTDELLKLAGMIDVITDDYSGSNSIIYIDDLKTCAPMAMKSKKSYFYHMLDYGYFRQLAIYKHLVKLQDPTARVVCRHIVIGSGDYYPIKLFTISDKLIDREWPFIEMMIKAIREEKDFIDPVPTWDDAILITNPDDNN